MNLMKNLMKYLKGLMKLCAGRQSGCHASHSTPKVVTQTTIPSDAVVREGYIPYDPTQPVCIVYSETGDRKDSKVLGEHGTDQVRVFSSEKSARRWIKRNILSPKERQKLYFVQAPLVR